MQIFKKTLKQEKHNRNNNKKWSMKKKTAVALSTAALLFGTYKGYELTKKKINDFWLTFKEDFENQFRKTGIDISKDLLLSFLKGENIGDLINKATNKNIIDIFKLFVNGIKTKNFTKLAKYMWLKLIVIHIKVNNVKELLLKKKENGIIKTINNIIKEMWSYNKVEYEDVINSINNMEI